jgi:excisionase family DNA binding protein
MDARRMTIKEVADELHVSEATVYRLMKNGKLGFIRASTGDRSGRRLVGEDQLEAFIARSRVDPDDGLAS